MKKFLIFALAMLLALSMFACSKNDPEAPAPEQSQAEAPAEEPTEAPTEEPNAAPAPEPAWPDNIVDVWVMTMMQEGDFSMNPADFGMEGRFTFAADGSVVIIHSSPSKSVTGCKGGGVQLSALNPNGNSTDCEAYRLANYYQTKYFPEWAARYQAGMRSFSEYLGFERTGVTGIFRWDPSGSGLSDPDGFAELSAAEILADLFGE